MEGNKVVWMGRQRRERKLGRRKRELGDESTTQKWKILGLTKYGKFPLYVT